MCFSNLSATDQKCWAAAAAKIFLGDSKHGTGTKGNSAQNNSRSDTFTFTSCDARTANAGMGSSCAVALMCEVQILLWYVWGNMWSCIHGGMSWLKWTREFFVVRAQNDEVRWLTLWPNITAQSCFDHMVRAYLVFTRPGRDTFSL